MSNQTIPITKPLNIPRVIGFSFQDYRANEVTKARSAECRNCGRTVKEKAGTTSNFLRHLRKHHPDIYQLYQDSKQAGPVVAPSKVNPANEVNKAQASKKVTLPKTRQVRKHAPVIVKAPASTKISSTPSTKKDTTVESIVDLIIEENFPLDIGESEKFGSFLKRLGTKFKPISQDMVCSELANQSSAIVAGISRRLSAVQSVNVTVNLWSDCVKRTFIAMTAHILEDQGSGLKLSSFLLSCQRIVGEPNAAELVSAFTKILDDLHILQKLDYITIPDIGMMKTAHTLSFLTSENSIMDYTLDNGCNLDDESIWCSLDKRSMKALRAEVHECAKYSQLDCYSHTLSRCIEDTIEKTECIRCAVTKVCCLVTRSFSNPELKRFLTQNGANFKELMPNSRRWEHTMLAIKIVVSCDYEKLCGLTPPQITLELDEIELLEELDYMMGPFVMAVKQTKYGMNHTVSAVLPTVLSLYKHLLDVRAKTQHLSTAATELADALYCNFKGVFANVGMTGPEIEVAYLQDFGESVYILAAVLDPAYGLDWLSDVHANESAKSILKKRVCDDILIEAESSACLEGYNDQQHSEDGIPAKKARKIIQERDEIFDQVKASNQLKTYLHMAENGCEGFTCFQFWTKYRTKFHLLFPVARRVLAVPATEPEVEHVFAFGGVVTKQKQASIGDTTLSHLISLKVNRDGESRSNAI